MPLAFYYVAIGILALADAVAVLTPIFVGDANLVRFQTWLWNAPQIQQVQIQQGNPTSEDVEILFGLVQRYMAKQHEVQILQNQILSLPALPSEGY